ncbi:hypothetical protein [Streptomyces adustus]|uniref:hypothetical protein n=1 Tax=Streptomyces adustus TaxID=1609272 RepID=UPI003720295E
MFIMPGQGSEAGDGRKGVHHTPKSALAALMLAYTATNAPGISRALLLAFAKAVLERPDAMQSPEAEDGTSLICYGEQYWVEGRTPITAGMVIAPEGLPTGYVADKTWFDETFPVELGRPAPAAPGSTANSSTATGTSTDTTATAAQGVPLADPRDLLATLRRELPARVELVEGGYQQAVDVGVALAQQLGLHVTPKPWEAGRQWDSFVHESQLLVSESSETGLFRGHDGGLVESPRAGVAGVEGPAALLVGGYEVGAVLSDGHLFRRLGLLPALFCEAGEYGVQLAMCLGTVVPRKGIRRVVGRPGDDAGCQPGREGSQFPFLLGGGFVGRPVGAGQSCRRSPTGQCGARKGRVQVRLYGLLAEGG